MLKRLIFLSVALMAMAGLALAVPCTSVTGADYVAGYTCTLGDKQFTLGPEGLDGGELIPDAATLTFTESGNLYTVALGSGSALPDVTFSYSVQVLPTSGMHISSVLADFEVNGAGGAPAYTKTLEDADGDVIATLNVSFSHRPVVVGVDATFLNVTDTYIANGGNVIGFDNVFTQTSDTPEPASFLLFGGAIALLGIGRRLW